MLAKRFGRKVRFGESMARHTTWRIGGPADAMVFPESEDDVRDLVALLNDHDTDWFVMGGGSNLLVLDGGIRGVVISPAPGLADVLEAPFPEGRGIRVQAGASLAKACRFAVSKGFSGLEFAAGIPGTVGGAVTMNAGIPGAEMSDVVSEIGMIGPEGETMTIGRSELDYSYRRIGLPRKAAGPPGRPGIIVSAVLTLRKGDPEHIRRETEEMLARRNQSQPGGLTAGSVFKNPPEGPAAGRLIDRAGLKGYAAGGAAVSEKHANFIVNRGDATASDVLELMETIRRRVKDASGVELEPEVRVVGEEKQS